MQFYRLIKPLWAQPTLSNGEPNPKFLREIPGDRNVIEGCQYTIEQLQEMNQLGYNIYFFPNHPSKDVYSEGTKYLNGKSIDVFNFVFVDMDLKDGVYSSKEDFLNTIVNFPLRPTMVVDSGNGVHVYWRINNLTREQFVLTQLLLLRHFKTDESVWTVLQLMRLPGYNNTKDPNNPKPAEVLQQYSSGKAYEISELVKYLGDPTQKDAEKAKRHIDRLEGRVDVSFTQDVDPNELPETFLNVMAEFDEVSDLFNDPASYGDRSRADMKLANVLYKKGLNRKEAYQVICNSQKALEKGPGREQYAALTVDKVYNDRSKNKFRSAADMLREGNTHIDAPQVFGPSYLDTAVLGEPWRLQELLGIISGPGVGKTSMALNIIRDIIHNNSQNDDIFIFFSLEMPVKQIIKRWVKLVGENSPLTERLFVIGSMDDEGMPRNIGLQEIYEYSKEITRDTGKKIGALIIDHFHIISTHINVNKHPNFGIESEQGTGYGNQRNLSLNGLATQLKSLVKTLDTFGILLTQTTKEKGVGDQPIAKDGAYGCSQFEWIMDRIVTIWQPLMRIQSRTPLRFLAYQYVKIREKHEDDRIYECDPKLLTYDLKSGNLTPPTSDQYQVFLDLEPEADEARNNAKKKQGMIYSLPIDLESIDRAVESLKVVR